jgi:hypothetical protein
LLSGAFSDAAINQVSTEIDTWMFEYWQIKIEQAGILGLKLNNENVGKAAYDYSESNQINCPYHTDAATQEIVASNIQRIIGG